MNIEIGEKIHVVVRRNFDSDLRRHFVGEVVSVDGAIVRLTGKSIIFDKTRNLFVTGKTISTTIINLAESGYIANIIPKNTVISKLSYVYDSEMKLIITDGESFNMDINEFGVIR